MDDEEYERLCRADVEQQALAYDEYKKSLAGQLEWLQRDLAGQTFSLEQAAAGLERSLDERRSVIAAKWSSECEAVAHRLLNSARDGGLGSFSSFEALWSELQKVEPWEKSLRRELYDEWISFQHYFDQDHLAELSVETDALLRYGGVIAAYAILETYVASFCEVLLNHLPPRRVQHLRKKGAGELRRNRELIHAHLGSNASASAWQALEVFIEMRHCIAHRSGVIDERLEQFAESFGPGKIAEIRYDRLFLSPATVVQFVAAIHGLFEELSKAAARRGAIRAV